MTDTKPAPRDAQGVAALLAASGRTRPRVGLELEMALLQADTLQPAPYEAIRRLLERMQRGGEFPEVIYEGELPIGLVGRAGDIFTLEPGGQLELSTAPFDDLVPMVEAQERCVAKLAAAAELEGLILIGGSLLPVAQADVPWMPKGRYRVMREWFASQGEAGALAHHMMQRTLSVQVSLDYSDAEDAAELLRLAFLLAPIATAAFAASPFNGAVESGFQSYRAEIWRFTDPTRTGGVRAAVLPGATLEDWANYALDVPMMFRIKEGDYQAQHGASFREVLTAGQWPDGTPVSETDTWNQLGGIFTEARLKKGLLELRSTDGQPPAHVGSIAAFWVGLLYDAQSRAAAKELLGALSLDGWEQALASVPKQGLHAAWDDTTVGALAQRLVALAQAGLERREPAALRLLEPLSARLAAGRTLSDELLESWRGEWKQERACLVEALRFTPEPAVS